MTSADYLEIAFLLAKKANFSLIRPNPFVGAVVVNENGEIIGQGYHQKLGQAHAEVFAIHEALQNTKDLSKCTLYVSLEPCSHFGKTPPCTQLILDNKIRKVVIGAMDPNPIVSGAKWLKENGIEVEICIQPHIVELNSTFNINQSLKRPKYIIKAASTLNGKIADRNGNSKWLSNALSRQIVHSTIRKKADAILTTAHTLIQDKATMNIRVENQAPEELNLIVIDKNLDLLKAQNKDLPIFYDREKTKIYLITPLQFNGQLPKNVNVRTIPFNNGKCDFSAINAYFLEENIYEILVEAGGKLNGSMLEEKWIDECIIFITPHILLDNAAFNIFNSSTTQFMNEKITLQLIHQEQILEDIMLKYKVRYKD